jgi:hypothetical protein
MSFDAIPRRFTEQARWPRWSARPVRLPDRSWEMQATMAIPLRDAPYSTHGGVPFEMHGLKD